MTEIPVSDRDLEIVELVRCGHTIDDIAAHYDVSRWTIRDRVREIRARVGAPMMRDLPGCVDELRAAGVDRSDPPA